MLLYKQIPGFSICLERHNPLAEFHEALVTLQDIAIIALLGSMLVLLWQHLKISQSAYHIARTYTRQQGVVLLDQSVVLRKMRLARSHSSLVALRRIYTFEFSTLGDQRYPGSISLLGARLEHIELAPFKFEERNNEITNN